jgi:hypothetical protein
MGYINALLHHLFIWCIIRATFVMFRNLYLIVLDIYFNNYTLIPSMPGTFLFLETFRVISISSHVIGSIETKLLSLIFGPSYWHTVKQSSKAMVIKPLLV